MAGGTRDTTLRFTVEKSGDSGLQEILDDLNALGPAGEKVVQKIKPFVDELNQIRSSATQVKSALDLQSKLANVESALATAKDRLADLNDEFDRSDKSSPEIVTAFKQAESSVKSLTAEQGRLQTTLAKTTASLQRSGIDTTNLASASTALSGKAAAVAATIRQMGEEATKTSFVTAALQKTFSALGSGLESVRSGINSTVTGLLRITGIAGGVSAALGALGVGRLFGGAVTSAKDFEAALSEVRAVSGATAAELALMRQAAEDASQTTKFSATEAVGALGELARASGNAADAISELKPTLNLAQAAGLDVAQTATILTTAVTQFGLSASDATRVADLFAREANSTNDNVQGLGNSMSYVAPLARQLGLSIEQTTATLGALAEQGFRGERAGTALRNVFSQLLDPSSQFREALAGIGIQGNDFTQIVQQLAAAGDQGKRALLSLDAEARPAIAALVTTGGAGIQRLTEDFKQAGGEAERTSLIMGQNFSGASARISNAFDSLRRSLVDPILAPLADQFDQVAVKMREFAKTADFQAVKQAILDFVTSGTDAFIKLVSTINFTEISKSISDFVGTSKTFFNDLKENVSTVGTAFSVTFSAIGTLFNGVKTIIFTGATVIAGSISLVGNAILAAGKAAAVMNGTYAQLLPTFKSIETSLGGVTAVAKEFGTRATAAGDATAASFQGIVSAISTTAPALDATNKKLDQTGQSGSSAAAGLAKTGSAAETASTHVESIAEPLGILPGLFGQVGDAATSGLGTVANELGRVGPTAAELREQITQTAFKLGEMSGTEQDGGAAAQALRDKLVELEVQLLNVQNSAQKTPASLQAMQTAFSTLGVSSQASLDQAAQAAKNAFDLINQNSADTAAGLADRQNAFIAYANAALKAANNISASEAQKTKAILDTQAAALQLNSTQITGPKVGKAPDVSPVTQGFSQIQQAADDSAEHVGQFSDTASRAIAEMAKDTGDHLDGVKVDMSNFSANARNAFAEVQDAALQFGIHSSADLDLYVKSVNRGYNSIVDSINAQKAAADNAISGFQSLTDEQLQAMAKSGAGLDQLNFQLQNMAELAREGGGDFSLLNDADLSRIQQAASATAQRVQQIAQAAAAATDQLKSVNQSLADQVDQQLGNDTAIEDRRHQKQLDDLAELASKADAEGQAQYQEAVANENELHALNLQHIEEQKKAAADAAAQQKKDNEEAQKPLDVPDTPTPTPNKTETVDLNINLNQLGIGPDGKKIGLDDASLQALAAKLTPLIIAQLSKNKRLT